MNKIILMGRLTANPEMKQTPSGTAVAVFTIAVNRRFAKDGQQQADFIRCTAWRQQAEFICKYFEKGSMICVVGNIQTRSWDGQDGKKQFATDIVVEEVYFAGGKKDSANQSEETVNGFESFQSDFSDDDLPF